MGTTEDLNGISGHEQKGLDSRLAELIAKKNDLTVKLAELQAENQSLREAAEAAKTEMATAIETATAEANGKLAELEEKVRRSDYREMLLADKVPPDDLDDMMDYVDSLYGRVQPAEGQAKPEFRAWYGDIRKTNKVLRAAMRRSVRDGIDAPAADAEAPEEPAEAAAAPAKGKPAAKAAPKPAQPKVVERTPGDTGRAAEITGKPGSPEWRAAKEKLKAQVFPGRRV